MYKQSSFSEQDVIFNDAYTSEKVIKLNVVTFGHDSQDSFDDGFKLKSLILAQNERWRQA